MIITKINNQEVVKQSAIIFFSFDLLFQLWPFVRSKKILPMTWIFNLPSLDIPRAMHLSIRQAEHIPLLRATILHFLSLVQVYGSFRFWYRWKNAWNSYFIKRHGMMIHSFENVTQYGFTKDTSITMLTFMKTPYPCYLLVWVMDIRHPFTCIFFLLTIIISNTSSAYIMIYSVMRIQVNA